MAWNQSNWFMLVFGVTGAPTANHFPIPGAGPSTANELAQAPLEAVQLIEARVKCGTAPGGVVVDTFTVRVSGVGSACAPTVTGTATTGTWTGAIAVAADDTLSIQYTQSAPSAISDVMITLILQMQD